MQKQYHKNHIMCIHKEFPTDDLVDERFYCINYQPKEIHKKKTGNFETDFK